MVVKRNPEQTRQSILAAAFEEIHRNGFRGTSLERILADTGLTKGALYHHFPNKDALGHAIIDEVLRRQIWARWIEPMLQDEDPIRGLHGTLRELTTDDVRLVCERGCPLNNLAQEMSPVDAIFREKIQALYRLWRGKIAEALARGQGRGYVREDIDCGKTATFIISSLEGAAGLAKGMGEPAVVAACVEGIDRYLESLRSHQLSPLAKAHDSNRE